jgi:hypothetical protein
MRGFLRPAPAVPAGTSPVQKNAADALVLVAESFFSSEAAAAAAPEPTAAVCSCTWDKTHRLTLFEWGAASRAFSR